MTDEQQVAPSEATEKAVASQEASEATENTEGQVEGQPAEGESPEDDKSESAKRRERRKAQMERLRKEAEEAKDAHRKAQERLEKVRQRAETSNSPPKEADFTDYNEYLVAMGAYHAAKRIDERDVREIEEATKAEEERIARLQQVEQAALAQSWAEQASEAKTRYADFEQVVYTAPISDGLAMLIQRSDMAADVAYYLGTHRDEAAMLSRANPIEQAMWLGRMEARLSLPKPKLQSDAPDPVSPVRPKPSGLKSPEKMSFEEYAAARKAGKIR